MRLLNPVERKYLYGIMLVTFVFSIWFYLGQTSRERFALAHGYGLIPEAKELIGILGITAAFIVSLLFYQTRRAKGFLLLSIGLGFILTRSIMHSSHMLNAMEQNSTLFEAIFEGENHFLQSIMDPIGALFLALGITSFLDKKSGANKLIVTVAILDLGLIGLVFYKAGGDMMFLFNNMTSSHGITTLPIIIALIPILGFLLPTILAFKIYERTSSDFNRLLFIGIGLLFMRALVHGVHTVFGIETHFFQSGFDALGGIVIGSAYFQTERDFKNDKSKGIWILAVILLIMAVVFRLFTFFKFR